ncbi:hypothetical protein OYC64_013644 [Pagothenia borchgrevinki]
MEFLYRRPVALSRRKRNILFPSGVRLCSQETFEQAVKNHQNYFQLRVCQETVWEAFKVFWDQLPERDQYQDLVFRCLDGSISTSDISREFSQSERHAQLIRSRLQPAAALNRASSSSAPPPCSSESGGVHSGGAAEEVVRTTGSGGSPEEVFPTDSGPEVLQKTSEGPEVVVPDTEGPPESEKVQDYSVEIQDVSPEGEEPPSEVMVQEVPTQATTVVLTKPTTEPESVTLETNPVLDPEPKDSSLGITRDVPSTQEVVGEDLPETPESVEEGTLAEPEEDPLETVIVEPEEEAEVPSQVSFQTTDRTIEQVSEAPEGQLSSGVTSDPFVLILQEDEDATVEPEEDLVLIEEGTKEYAEVIPTTAGLPAKEEEPPQGTAAVEDPVQEPAEETEITEVPAQEVVHVEDTGLVEEAKLVEDKEPREEPTDEDGLVEIAEETAPTRGITQEHSGEEVGEPEPEESEPEVAEEVVSESLLLTEPEVPEAEDPEEEPESVPEEEPESVPEEEPESVPEEEPESVPEEEPESVPEEESESVPEEEPESVPEEEPESVPEEEPEYVPEEEPEYVPEEEPESVPEEEPESVPEEEPESVPEEEVVQEGPSEISPEVGTPTGAGTAEPEDPVLEEVPVEVLPEGPLVEVPAENTPGPLVEVPAEKVEATTKYVVEYNNGNFPALTERPLDLDGFGNSFGLEDEDSIGNEIDGTLLWPPRALKEQVVELSLKLRGETFSDALRDPSSTQYQLLDRHFIRRIQDALERLPGFRSVRVVEFRPQKDLERGLVVLVLYSITLEVDGSSGVNNETLDFISLQNNLVEKNYPGAAEQPTVVYTITDFRNYITEALHKDGFLGNGSLEASQTAENSLLAVKTTSRPEAFHSMDSVLAAEKPPDAPLHEADLSKDDFLFDPWKGAGGVSTENDVFLLDESTKPVGLRKDGEKHRHLN